MDLSEEKEIENEKVVDQNVVEASKKLMPLIWNSN